jgi:hypothetical protein
MPVPAGFFFSLTHQNAIVTFVTMDNTIEQLHTVLDAAAHFEVTDSYIRRLCIEHNIGTKLARDRLLTDDDLQALRKVLPNA